MSNGSSHCRVSRRLSTLGERRPRDTTRGCVRATAGARFLAAGREPTLDEVLTDPLVALLMRRDGVSAAQLRAIVTTAQERLRGRVCCRSAG
jgi:hypothetical protein